MSNSTALTQASQQVIQPVDNCGICFEEPTVDNRIETACHHIFHRACHDQWLATAGSNGQCPTCRMVIGARVPGQLARVDALEPNENSNNQDLETRIRRLEALGLWPINFGM